MAPVEYRRLLGFRRVPAGTPRPAIFARRLAPDRCHYGFLCGCQDHDTR